MTEFNMYDAKTNLSKIAKLLEDKQEEVVFVNRNGKPLLEIRLANKKIFKLGSCEGMFEIPEDFDEWDISEDFEGEIFPE